LVAVPGDTILFAGCIDEDILLNTLDELWRRGLILERDQQRYDFQHELLRQYVYDCMSYSRRKHLQRRVAEALQKVYARDLDLICAELAHHFEIAGQQLEQHTSTSRPSNWRNDVFEPRCHHILRESFELFRPAG
jgi:predicted ATPase